MNLGGNNYETGWNPGVSGSSTNSMIPGITLLLWPASHIFGGIFQDNEQKSIYHDYTRPARGTQTNSSIGKMNSMQVRHYSRKTGSWGYSWKTNSYDMRYHHMNWPITDLMLWLNVFQTSVFSRSKEAHKNSISSAEKWEVGQYTRTLVASLQHDVSKPREIEIHT